MASKIGIDIHKEWVFHFGGLVNNETPIELIEKDGIISFKVLIDDEKEMRIDLCTLQKEEDLIEGKYTLLDSTNYKGKISFTILKGGLLFRGEPDGLMQRSKWAFSAKNDVKIT